MQIKKSATVSAVVGIALAGLAISSIPAQAFDPVSNSYAVVGSDTLEDVVGALANGTSVTNTSVRVTTSDSSTIGSFDATGTGTIITKPSGVRFQRPNGSGDGRVALEAQILGNTYTSTFGGRDTNYNGVVLTGTPIDIVRASSTKAVDATGPLGRYTFGRDAIAFAFGNSVTTGANGFIAAADMKKIYQCDAATLLKYNVTYAVIPQSGSGTRSDFLSKVGYGSDNLPTTAVGTFGTNTQACIKVGQEHDATQLGAGDVMPMSASRWIAMKNGVSYDKSNSTVSGVTVALGSFVANPNVTQTGLGSGLASVSSTGGVYKPVVAHYKDGTWGRDTYLFVDKRRVDTNNPRYDAVLAKLFDYADETSLTYQGGTSFSYANMSDANYPSFGASTTAAVKLKFGFLPASVQDYNVTLAK